MTDIVDDDKLQLKANIVHFLSHIYGIFICHINSSIVK